jgi:uncharacterized protein (DUF488 family)
MKLYTIGFTQKNAETFFGLLHQNQVARLVDIRLNPDGQLSGFAKREDLPFFLSRLADGCVYERIIELAPTKEILEAYRATHDWTHYKQQFEALLDERNIPAILDRGAFERLPSCLLCSEATPKQCHRRLVAERLAAYWPHVEITHL